MHELGRVSDKEEMFRMTSPDELVKALIEACEKIGKIEIEEKKHHFISFIIVRF